MRIEHLAINVAEPLEMARWYVEHLGFEVRRRSMEPPWGHFLADSSGQTMIEIYGRKDAPLPDYKAQHPAVLHLALVSEDVLGDVDRLMHRRLPARRRDRPSAQRRRTGLSSGSLGPVPATGETRKADVVSRSDIDCQHAETIVA